MTDDNQDILTAEDRELFLDIAKEIRKNPTKYHEAGIWLDEYSSEESYLKLQENNLSKLQADKKKFPTLPIEMQIKQLEQEIESKRIPALLIRFQEARDYLLEKYKDQQFIPEEDAKRIILTTWILTEPDAEKADLGITEFEKWSWEPIDDITKLSRGYANFLWFHGGKVFAPWMNLVRIAWAKTSAQIEHKASSHESNRILGDAWTLFGIPIHFRNLLSKVRKLKPWIRRISYLGLIILIIALVAFYTRSLWLPLIDRLARDSGEIEEITTKNKLLLSLKDICQDIDSRPLVQKEETAKRYVGIRVKNERLTLYDIRESGIEQNFHLTMFLPDEAAGQYVIGRAIICTVEKEKYPELIAAKQGLDIYVSGRIEYFGSTYIRLSEVSLRFE